MIELTKPWYEENKGVLYNWYVLVFTDEELFEKLSNEYQIYPFLNHTFSHNREIFISFLRFYDQFISKIPYDVVIIENCSYRELIEERMHKIFGEKITGGSMMESDTVDWLGITIYGTEDMFDDMESYVEGFDIHMDDFLPAIIGGAEFFLNTGKNHLSSSFLNSERGEILSKLFNKLKGFYAILLIIATDHGESDNIPWVNGLKEPLRSFMIKECPDIIDQETCDWTAVINHWYEFLIFIIVTYELQGMIGGVKYINGNPVEDDQILCNTI